MSAGGRTCAVVVFTGDSTLNAPPVNTTIGSSDRRQIHFWPPFPRGPSRKSKDRSLKVPEIFESLDQELLNAARIDEEFLWTTAEVNIFPDRPK